MKKVSLKEVSKLVRRNILNVSFNAHMGHIGSSLSVVEILVALYFKVLNIDPKNISDPERDRFILSKGHAGLSLYCVLYERGFITKDELFSFCQDGSKLLVHPEWNGLAGIEHGTGSLGHGLPVAVGMAHAAKLLGKKLKIYLLLSDSELDEGTTWEAALFAGHHKLDNLTVILDNDNSQALGKKTEVLNPEPLEQKWKSFNFETISVDGHNLEDLVRRIKEDHEGRPKIIIANTKMGKGVSFMEGDYRWHYYDLKPDQLSAALSEIKI